MKIILSFLVLTLCISIAVNGQNFTGRTNDLVLDVPRGIKDGILPSVQWNSPKLEFSNSEKNSLQIDARINSQVYLKEIAFRLTGITGVLSEKKITPPANSVSYDVKLQIHLLDGQNHIEIIATTNDGVQVSSTRTVTMGLDAIANAVAADRKDYALLIAIDKYDHWSDLVNPVNDAQTLATELKGKYGFEVEVLENPDQETVFIKLREYAEKKYKPQDQLMVFFAGHGFFDETFGEGYVVAKNSLENDKAKTTYISHNRLRSVINNISCEHIFLAMDVCFGGTFDPVLARSRALDVYEETSVSEYLVRKLSQKTRKYLTSGGKEYVSDGVAGHHSPFALKFLQALKESGGADRILTLQELKSYVEKLKPEPRFGGFGDDQSASDFVFVAKQ
jgi:hypothetical protein